MSFYKILKKLLSDLIYKFNQKQKKRILNAVDKVKNSDKRVYDQMEGDGI